MKCLLIHSKLQSNSVSSTSPLSIQIPNEQKLCEKSLCGKKFPVYFHSGENKRLGQKKDGDEDEKSQP